MPSRNNYCLIWVSLILDVRYLFMAAPAKTSRCSLPWTRGISSQPPLWTLMWSSSSLPSCACSATAPCMLGSSSRLLPLTLKCKKAKWLSGEALQIAVKRREVKSKGEKQRYKHLNAEFQRIARRDKKAFLSDQCKEIEENNRNGKD